MTKVEKEFKSGSVLESSASQNLIVPGFLIGVIIVISVIFFKIILPSPLSQTNDKVFNLTLQNEQYVPSKIQLSRNDQVTLNIENKDNILHGLHLPDFNISESIPPLSKKTVQFVATKNGQVIAGCANTQHKEKLEVEIL